VAAVFLTIGALAWAVTLVVAPFVLVHGASLAAALVYELGALICHQRPERSFHLAGVQLPVCARCFGLYLSGAAGALAAWLRATRTIPVVHSYNVRPVLMVVTLPTAVTVSAEWFGIASSSNVIRAAAALPLGAYLGWLFVRSLRAEGPARRVIRADAL
jgi:uncharacterized membrane protein